MAANDLVSGYDNGLGDGTAATSRIKSRRRTVKIVKTDVPPSAWYDRASGAALVGGQWIVAKTADTLMSEALARKVDSEGLVLLDQSPMLAGARFTLDPVVQSPDTPGTVAYTTSETGPTRRVSEWLTLSVQDRRALLELCSSESIPIPRAYLGDPGFEADCRLFGVDFERLVNHPVRRTTPPPHSASEERLDAR